MEYTFRRLWVHKSSAARQVWEDLLRKAHIRTEEAVEYTVGMYDGDKLIATGSFHLNVLKCIAVCKQYTGGETVTKLISHLMNEVFARGYTSCYVYTKPDAVQSFLYMGFKEVARVKDQLVFLERGARGIKEFAADLSRQKVEGERVAGIVMNANPFTRGHRYLVEKASRENDVVHLFVLEEDLSAFPAPVRRELVERGTAHLENVYVHGTGDYMVSAKTFPSYFLKEDADVTRIQATLDALIFRDRIAPALGINRRYVGEEPLSFATNIYNKALQEVLQGTVEVVIIPRLEAEGDVISASRVRAALKAGDIAKTEAWLPETTYQFLLTEQGQRIIEQIQNKE